MKTWVHSIPTWTMGPRGANPKFQAGVELAGIASVADRMTAITELSNKIKTAGDRPLLTSAHILHEIRSSNPKYRRFNSPNAITFRDLTRGIKRGDFPHILAVTAPAFGFPGVERGAILSSDPKKVQMARDLHTEAIERAQELKEMGLGKGVVIWWPAFDSRRLDLLDQQPMSLKDALDRMTDFWIDIINANKATIWLEWKPSDPGIDYICTLKLAIDFCTRINKEFDLGVMFINNEWAHFLIGGLPVHEGTKRTIEAKLFTGFLHVNSAQLLPISLEALIQEGSNIQNVATGIDWDWAVGMGGQHRWSDQERAVDIIDCCPAETAEAIYAEHDINPAGQDPIEFAKVSINNLERMILTARDARG